jgi:nucleotide-binding universal stress UspA family protein
MTEPLGELQFRRLLVAVDGSAESDLALSAAITAARRNNAAVTLVAVSPPLQVWPGGLTPPLTQDDIDEATDKLVREACARVPQDVPVHTLLRHGKAGPEIVAAAREGDYDAILIGARGVGRFHGLVGSVSQYVLHHSPITVIVAHPAPAPRD